MFARLFSNIGIRSMLNSIALSLLVCLSIFWIDDKLLVVNSISLASNQSISPFWAKIIFVLSILLFAFIFNEAQNRLHIFEGNYHSTFIGVIASLSLFVGLNDSPSYWLLGLGLILLLFLQALVQRESRIEEAVFLLSLLAGFVSYQVPEAIFFAIIILATLLLSAKFTAKSLAAIILGYGAATYFVVAVEGWFGVDVFTSYKNSLSALSFGLPSVSWIDNYGLLIWPMLAIFSILVLLSFKKRLNNLQRKVIDLWVILVILLILASFSLGNKTFWLSMLVYSIAYALSLTIEAVQNRWVKDSIYLLVLLSLYSIFLIT
ncbi:MAG: hypothetical protein DA405_03195 [Bacteroidetes bacterium]|nr:MAG: hypothetical protein DA405_03195 [Bacteroidota bacterium]